MGQHRRGQVIGLLISVLCIFSTSTGFAGNKKYVVVLKSQESYRAAKDMSQRSGGFLGTRAVAQNYLDNLDIAIVTSDEQQILEIQKNPLVASIEEEYIIPLPKFKLPKKLSDRGNYIPPKNSELTWGLKAVKADKAWATTKGAGVRVMVLDTGIDETHVDLVGRIEKTKTFMGTGMKDDIGHGTHTSGTIAADGAGSGLVGVAPEAKILMGKVCSGSGCSSTGILQGVDWAVSEKVDVVNMSLGGPFLSPGATQAYQKAEAAGVMIVAASGNSGNGSVSYPAAIDTVLAVGALMPDLTKASFSQWGPQLDVMAPGVAVYSTVPAGMGREGIVKVDGVELPSTLFMNSQPAVGLIGGQFMFAGLGKAADVQGKDFSGNIALIQRGEIAFTEKVNNAIAAGAVGVVIYNNVPGIISGSIEKVVKIPVLFIEQAAGEDIAQKLNQNISVATELGMMVTDYASFDGTSMASPHAAGVAALVRATNKSLTPSQVRDLLKSTATPLLPNNNNEMGKGLIDAEKAVDTARALGLSQAAGF